MAEHQQHILIGKVHYSLEDPITHLFYHISDSISPFLYNLGITPNLITISRLIIGVTAFTYFFQNKMYEFASLLYLLSYFGDCLDGHYARKYKMETLAGDYLDNLTDFIIIVVSLYYIVSNISHENDWVIYIIVFLFFLSLIQIGCQERYIYIIKDHKNSSHSLHNLKIKSLCSKSFINDDELESTMEFLKLFGIGVYHLIVAIVIWNFKHLLQEK